MCISLWCQSLQMDFIWNFQVCVLWRKKNWTNFLRQFSPTTEEMKLFVTIRMLPQSVHLNFDTRKKMFFFSFLSFLSCSHFSLPEFPFCPRVAQYVVNKIGLDSILCHHTDVNEEEKKKMSYYNLFCFSALFFLSLSFEFSSEKQWLLCTDWINPCLSYLNVKQNTRNQIIFFGSCLCERWKTEKQNERTHTVYCLSLLCVYIWVNYGFF